MKTTTRIVALTTETENELKVNDQVNGMLRRAGRRLYTFIQAVRQKRNPFPEEICYTLARITRGKIYANGYGVTLRLYIRHTEYKTNQELKTIIQSKVNDLCKQL